MPHPTTLSMRDKYYVLVLLAFWLPNESQRHGNKFDGASGCCCVDGAIPMHQQRMSRRRSKRRRSSNHPPQSSVVHDFDDYPDLYSMKEAYDDSSSSSYFERNNHMISPPLNIPKQQRRRRSTQQLDDNADNNARDVNAQLRHDLLNGYSNNIFDSDDSSPPKKYDKLAYPWEYIWQNQTTSIDSRRTGVPVEMNINFHRILSVDIIHSTMDFIIWLRFIWFDPRLSWNPSEYNNITKTWFWEMSEIWTPDIELYNMASPLSDTLEDVYAHVSHEGIVTWDRPGHLIPSCKFVGLEYFPFDTLSCQMEFGSWSYSEEYIAIKLYEEAGYSLGGVMLTPGEMYMEYMLAKESPVSAEVYAYKGQDDVKEDAKVHAKDTAEENWPGEKDIVCLLFGYLLAGYKPYYTHHFFCIKSCHTKSL